MHAHNKVNEDIIWRSLFLSERKAFEETSLSSEVPAAYQAKLQKLRARANPQNPVMMSYIDELDHAVRVLPSAGIQDKAAWLSEFQTAIHHTIDTPISDELHERAAQVTFSSALMPLAAYFLKKCRDISDQKGLEITETVFDDFYMWLQREFSDIAGLALYCEYRDDVQGASPAAYTQWSENMAKTGWMDLIYKLPLLGRFLIERGNRMVVSIMELIERFGKDKSELFALGMISNPDDSIVYVDLVMSDFHKNGRAVSRIIFSSDEALIYKPKSLANDAWFFDHFAKQEGSVFKYIKNLNRGEYGWVEDITDKVGASTAQGHKNSLARAAGLAYLMNATDLHPENIFADDDGIFLIDTETIINAVVPTPFNSTTQEHWEKLSVLNTEIFKSQFSIEERDKQVQNEQNYHLDLQNPVYYFTLCASEGVKIEIDGKRRKEEEAREYTFSDRFLDLNVADVVAEFVKSCTAYRQAILKEKIWETVPDDVVCRLIPRPTTFYARIFQRMYHPFSLKDAALVSLDIADLMLKINEFDKDISDKWCALARDEIKQLENGDIPYFWHYAHSADVHSPNGLVCADFMTMDAVSLLREKIVKSGADDIKSQSLLVDASLSMAVEQMSGRTTKAQHMDATVLTQDIEFDLCADITESIIGSANVYNNANVRWVSYQPAQSGSAMVPTIYDTSYYSGYWGIILYLNAFEGIAKGHRNTDLSSRVSEFLDGLPAYWEGNPAALWNTSELIKQSGVGGIAGQIKSIHALLTFSPDRWSFLRDALWSIIDKIEHELVSRSAEPVISLERDKNLYDYIGGACGLLPVLCNVASLPAMPDATRASINFIIDVIARSLKENLPLYLSGKISSPWAAPPLVGFAHGNAGVISSIVAYMKCKATQAMFPAYADWVDVLKALLAHDDTTRDPVTGLWFDRRHALSEKVLVNKSWCHGLAGIGQSRLDLLDIPELADVARHDLRLIVDYIKDGHGISYSDFLCCGVAGEINFLSTANTRLGADGLDSVVSGAAQSLAQRITQTQRLNSIAGTTSFKLCPGLFQGAAGIGYTLLKRKALDLPSLV